MIIRRRWTSDTAIDTTLTLVGVGLTSRLANISKGYSFGRSLYNSRTFGPQGPVFGRKELGGSSFAKINDNSILRVGWGWAGFAKNGQHVFRASADFLKKFGVSKKNSNLHLRQSQFNTPKEVVELIDRFLDDQLLYPLKWDDFISWDNDNPTIENIHKLILSEERLALSNIPEERQLFIKSLIRYRNQLSGILGIEPKGSDSIDLTE